MIGQAVGVLGAAICILLLDITGRRPTMIGGSIGCTVTLYLAAGLGTEENLSPSGVNVVLACFMLLPAFTRISASTNAFLTGAEIGGVRMRKKIMVSPFIFKLFLSFKKEKRRKKKEEKDYPLYLVP